MLIFAKWFHIFHEWSDDKQGDYRAHYVNRFRDLLQSQASDFMFSTNGLMTNKAIIGHTR